MTPHPHAPPPSEDDRATLDEALFGGFSPPPPDPTPPPLVPFLPEHVVVSHVVPVDLPEPVGYHEPEPFEPPPMMAVNTGLTLSAGDTAAITAAHLCVTGPPPPLVDLMILSPPEHGTLLRDGFALTGGDVVTQEDIDRGRLSYRHDGGRAAADGFTFATPDELVPATVFALTIEPVLRAPELNGDGRLDGLLTGCRVGDVLAGAAHCADADQPPGIAVVAVAGRGVWQYSVGGDGWADVGEVHHGRALLLGEADRMRFVPAAGWAGTARVTYRAWDPTAGTAGQRADLARRGSTGGATAFSRATASASTVIAPPAPPAAAVEPWAGEPTLAELVGEAVAVVRLEGPGQWQFSTDAGRTWHDFGAVYHGRARLLDGCDRVRFLPEPGARGRVSLSGRAWDGRGGGPGATVNLAAHGACGDGTPFAAFVRKRTWWLRN